MYLMCFEIEFLTSLSFGLQWALHDLAVPRSMLEASDEDEMSKKILIEEGEGLEGLEQEAKHNTEIFSPSIVNDGKT